MCYLFVFFHETCGHHLCVWRLQGFPVVALVHHGSALRKERFLLCFRLWVPSHFPHSPFIVEPGQDLTTQSPHFLRKHASYWVFESLKKYSNYNTSLCLRNLYICIYLYIFAYVYAVFIERNYCRQYLRMNLEVSQFGCLGQRRLCGSFQASLLSYKPIFPPFYSSCWISLRSWFPLTLWETWCSRHTGLTLLAR